MPYIEKYFSVGRVRVILVISCSRVLLKDISCRRRNFQSFLQHSQNILQRSESEQRSDKLHRMRSISASLVPS